MRTAVAVLLLALVLYGGLIYGAVSVICDETGPDW